ncbi:MAG: pyridoxal phosphate-dependent aminotransferase [Muribaculaceae bacterium]|nr:pyridoxal phosphate-dependent aminotransferase [Muribaculaceae bacterium]
MFPITDKTINDVISQLGIVDITTATIRQICAMAAALEEASGEKFVHLEIGNPGLAAERIGIDAEKEALEKGVANQYPDIAGIPQLKKAGSEFIKAFLDLNIPPKCIIPTVGSMQGSYTLYTLLKQRDPKKDSILIFNPGFPAQTHQAKMLGINVISFDIYDYRGAALKDKLDELLSSGRVSAMIYSNPNNPSWTNFTDEELRIIGEAATKYDVIVLEDLAYMGMDFRTDFSKPKEPPYIPTVGKYTDNYILLISGSKIFSYAGQRIAIVCMSPAVFERKYKVLEDFYEMPNFGESYIYGVLYTASSGACHSAQYAMAEMLNKAATGELPFIQHASEYGERAKRLKKMFLDNGFHIVYDKDGESDISDGFFFTVGYDGMSSEKLQLELMKFGISSISLPSTGSTRPGVRACVSMITNDETFAKAEKRLKSFHETQSSK